jgi:hypothetical protein
VIDAEEIMSDWAFLPAGYLLSVLIEVPVLVLALARPHSLKRRLLAGLWLTACTYPVVVLVLPALLFERSAYLAVAETFAPLAECMLFYLAFQADLRRADMWRDWAAIAAANLASFGVGEALHHLGTF